MGFEINVTIIIIVITGLISYKAFNDRSFFDKLKHYPYEEARSKDYIRWISSGFLHGNLTHLLINMYVLYGFGQYVEYQYMAMFGIIPGRLIFIFMYLLTIVAADIPTYFKHKDNPRFASIGASGAVSGILFIYILMDPWGKLGILFLPGIEFPAILFGIVYLIYTSWAGKNSNDNIDHDAHFYGALFGILFTIVLQPSLLMDFVNKIASIF